MDQSAQYLDAPGVMMSLAAYIDDTLHSLFKGSIREGTVDDLVNSAEKARDRKDWAQAAKAYAAAISSGSTCDGVKVQLGHALKEIGDFDAAERMYREFLRNSPDDADIHLQLGHLFNKKDDLITALAFYEQAHKLAPQDTDIALHAGIAKRNVGRIEVIRKRSQAMALVSAGKWDEARRLLRPLVALDGEDDLIGILANVTKEIGRLDEATTLYGSYLRYATTSGKQHLVADCHLQLGHLHKIRGELPIALTHFLAARKIERESEDADPAESGVGQEIIACLREIYPCFIFQD
jgi:tetratricopeptide (TPR) repeat protein